MNQFVTVYSAEIVRRLRSRIFLVGLLLGALGMFALIKFPQFVDSTYVGQARKIVLAGDPSLAARAKPLLSKDFTLVGTMRAAGHPTVEDLRAHEGAKGIVELRRTPAGLRVRVYARDPGDIEPHSLRRDLLPLQLELGAHLSPGQTHALLDIPVTVRTVASKFGTAEQSNSARVIAYLLLFLLYLLVIMNGQLLMSSVAEEKTSRIAELLIASVNPTALLAGKIAASVSLAFVQLAVWIAVSFAAGGSPGASAAVSSSGNALQFSLADVSLGELAGFLLFFVLAFLETATLFAAVGSLVNRTEDIGSLSGPLILPIVAAFVIAIMGLAVPDSPIVVLGSLVPIVSPFIMLTRMVVSNVPNWQLVLSVAVNLLAIWGIAVLGGKIYRLGMLLYGRPPKFAQIFKALRSS